MHLLTPTGVSQKINLTLHFLKRKQEEYERLREEIVQLQAKIIQNSMHTKSISEDLYTLSTKA